MVTGPGGGEPPQKFPLLSMFASSEEGEVMSEQLNVVLFEYGYTMMTGQMLEWLCKLAAPATFSGDGDEDAAAVRVAAGLNMKLFDAIEALAAALPPGRVSPDLLVRLHGARKARNALAHSWFWDGGVRTMSGRALEVVADLQRQRSEFDDLITELVNTVFGPAMALLDISADEFAAATDVFSTRSLQRPDLIDGLEFPDGASDWIERLGIDLGMTGEPPQGGE